MSAITPPTTMLAPDTVLQQRYRIVRLIGKGGMGAVYEAIDQRLGNQVALKQTLASNDQAVYSLEREARLLAGLRHASLPKVTDHFVDDSGQYLVMEFITGDDLGTLLTRLNHAFEPQRVLAWADQLLRTLEYLHRQQPPVLHRDIKPQNLKLTADDEIVLLDFGLAKGPGGAHSLMSSSIFGYTPHYAPLEQINHSGTEPRSDLYSLAATLYHLLTGVRPPDALTRATAVLRRLPDPLIPLTALNDAVPQAVSATLMQALALNADERPLNAADMRAALQETTQGDESVIAESEAPVVSAAPDIDTMPAALQSQQALRTNQQPRLDPPAAAPAAAQPKAEVPAIQIMHSLTRLVTATRPVIRAVALRGGELYRTLLAILPAPWRRYALPAFASIILLALMLTLTLSMSAPPSTDDQAAAEPARPAPTTAVTPAAPTPRATEPPRATVIAKAPSVIDIMPTDLFTGALPAILTISGANLDQGQNYALSAEDVQLPLEIIQIEPAQARVRLNAALPESQSELILTLAIDGQAQSGVTVRMRDFLQSKEIFGVRPEYAYTDRVGVDEIGAYTSLRMTPSVDSDRFGVLRNGDIVEILRVDTEEWYYIRIREAANIWHVGAVGWIERWLIDDHDVPKAPQPLFTGLLGQTPTDRAVQCGREFNSSIFGSVEDNNGDGISGATISVTSADERNRFTTVTRADGTFTIGNLGCTIWIVRLLDAPGITEVQASPVQVTNLNGGRYTAAEVRFRQAP